MSTCPLASTVELSKYVTYRLRHTPHLAIRHDENGRSIINSPSSGFFPQHSEHYCSEELALIALLGRPPWQQHLHRNFLHLRVPWLPIFAGEALDGIWKRPMASSASPTASPTGKVVSLADSTSSFLSCFQKSNFGVNLSAVHLV